MSTKNSRGKNKTMAVVVNPEDVYNGRQFILLMEFLAQYSLNLMLTATRDGSRQQGKKAAMPLANKISMPQELTTGHQQGSLLNPVLYGVYTKGLADLSSNAFTWLPTFVSM